MNSQNQTTSPYASLWSLDPGVAMLNHGSFGACPTAILQEQTRLRAQMEAEPVRFFTRELPPLLDESRNALAELVGAEPGNLAFVRNATFAVNSVLRSIDLRPGDEVLTINQDYNACRCAVQFEVDRRGATLVVAEIPFPIESPTQAFEAIVARITDKTRLVMVDHLTSPTAIVLPIEDVVAHCNDRGIDTLIDGSHTVGMLPLELERLGATYYTSNCHKWLCAPKGVGFLHVRRDRQEGLQPAVISHGYNVAREGYSRFADVFDWTGTDDPTPYLCLPEAIRFLTSLLPAGIEGVMRRNRELAISARSLLTERLGFAPVCDASMLGSLAAVMLPDDVDEELRPDTTTVPTATHRIQVALMDRFGIEVPVFYWPTPPKTLLRVSAQIYNSQAQYEYLVESMRRGA